MKLRLCIILVHLLCFFYLEVHAGSRNPEGCATQSCHYKGLARISFEGLTHAKKPQILDVSTLNLKPHALAEKSVQSTKAAISIAESDFNTISAVGNSWLGFMAGANKSFSMNIGTANNSSPQTWTLPSDLMNNFIGATRADFILPSSLPVGLQLVGANKVMKSYFLDENDNDLLIYDHFDVGVNSILQLGTSYDLELGTDQGFDEPNYEYADVPLDLGDNWTITEDEEDYISGLNLNRLVQSVDINGYGTISTPEGVFNCLRISYLTQYYSRPNESSAFVLNSTTHNIGFVTKEGYYFYGEVNALSGTATVTNFSYRKIVPTSILTELSDVKLNNNSKGVTINTNNDIADPSAILDISSNNQGILIPRIAEANRPVTPATGLLIYQIDNSSGFYFYDGTAWQKLNSAMPLSLSNNSRVAHDVKSEVLRTFGKSQLKKGIVFIKFDNPQDDFENLQIDVRLEGDCKGLYVSKKTREGFEVKELQRGKSNAKFSWEID